ncbi:MAG: acetylornithine deacetylase [Pseudomonadota bacterium]
MTPLQPTLELLDRLIAFPTVSKSSNLEMIHCIKDYLTNSDVRVTVLPNAAGDKAALFASVGPDVPGGVVLSGHSDVVPTDGQDWSSDPWHLRADNDRLYGRGTCDMKGFCASVLARMVTLNSDDLQRPIHMALSYDEEIGCLGVAPLIDHMRKTNIRPEAVIVGEPSSMEVVHAHKGTWSLLTRVKGHEVHSSICHKGVSAVMVAARLVTWLEDQMIANAEQAASMSAEPDFDPPYTTLHVGRIKGGTSGNITAGYCSFPTDIRVLPNEDMAQWYDRYITFVQETEAKMREIHSDTSISVQVMARVAGLAVEDPGAAEALVQDLTGGCRSHMAGIGSEAGLFQEAGFSTVICGPGSIGQAHQPDEYVSKVQLGQCDRFMQDLGLKLSA